MADLPWEDFQQAPSKQTGPWDDFAPAKAKKTREQVTQEVGQAQARADVANPPEEMSVLDKVADAAYWPTRVLSRTDPVTALTDAAYTGVENRAHVPFIDPSGVKDLLRYSAIAPNDPNGVMAGVNRTVSEMVSGLTSPHGVMGLVSGGVNRMLPATTFAPPMVLDAPQAMEGAVQSFQQDSSNADRTAAILRLLGDVGFPLGMAKGAVPGESVPSGVRIPEMRKPLEDIPGGGDVVPANRQLPEYAEGLIQQRINPAPTVLGPVEGEGRTVYRLPAQREPVGLLPEKSSDTLAREAASKAALNPTPIDRTFEGTPVKAPDYILPKEQRPVRITEPVVEAAKIDESPAKLVNPSDYEQYLDVQKKISEKIKANEFDTPEFKQLWQENENIKNRNGGMPPKPPTTESGAAGDTGKGAGIGQGINAAIERNKEAGSIPNVFGAIRDKFKKGEEVLGKFSPLDKYEAEKEAVKKPMGVGRLPGVGRILDPRAKEFESPEGQSLLTHARQVSKGEALSSVALETAKNKFGRFPFKPAKEHGKVVLDNGQKVFLSDAIESYLGGEKVPFNENQKKAVQYWVELRDEVGQWMKSEGVKALPESGKDFVDLDPAYMRRSAIGRLDVPTSTSNVGVGKSIGSKRSIQKERHYPSQEFGAKEGVVYDNDFWSLTGDFLKQAYRAVADQRLANDPTMQGGKSAKFMEEVLSYHPAFKGRYFSPEAAEKIRSYLENAPSSQMRKIDKVNSFMKKVSFSSDISTSMNQLLLMAPSHPVGWGKALGAGVSGFVKEGGLGKYLSRKENYQAAKRLADAGIEVVRLDEFLSDTQKEGIQAKGQSRLGYELNRLIKSPESFNGPIKWGNRAMTAQFAVAKVELAKALWPLVEKGKMSKQEWAEHIANTVGSAPTKSIGVTESRGIMERLTLSAPTNIRAVANVMADAVNPRAGRSGWEARKNLASMAIATTGLTYAALKSLQQAGEISEDEVKERTTPGNPKFLKVPIRVGDKVVEMGLGNTYISLMRLAGDLSDKHQESSVPLRRFGTARLAPWLQAVKEIESGKDYKGDPTAVWESLIRSLVPISASPLTDKGGMKEPANYVAAAAQFGGLNTSPESFGAKKKRKEFEITKDVYKLDSIKKLNTEQRAIVQDKAAKVMEKEKDANSDKVALQAVTSQAERAKRIQSQLSPRAKMMLEENGLNVPQIQPTGRTVGKYYSKEGKLGELPVRLDREELDNFEEQYAKELSKRLENIDKGGGKVNKERFEMITKSVREMIINKSMSEVNRESRRRRGGE